MDIPVVRPRSTVAHTMPFRFRSFGPLGSPLIFVRLKEKLIRERKERNVRWKKFHFYEINYEKMTKNVTIRLPEDNFSDGWLLEPMSVGPLS
jgi:hypothetical protein